MSIKGLENTPKLSVVVPVYNTEAYLAQCLDSLVSQAPEDMEVIVVNDGSPDGSQSIIDRYAEAWPRKIRAFVKENGGLGDARNFGLEQATGEYLSFVDSDDWLEPGAYEALIAFADDNGCDAVVFDKYVYDEETTEKWIAFGYDGEREFNQTNALLHSTQPAHAWNKLYKRTLFDRFAFDPVWYEDVGLIPAVLSYAENIGYLRKPLYTYRQSVYSITHDDRSPRNLDVIKAWDRVIDLANSSRADEIAYAVYASILIFMEYRPRFAASFAEYAQDKSGLFENNPYIQKEIRDGTMKDMSALRLIPKMIHYFWFGRGDKPEIYHRCRRSWETFAPGYKIVEWTEENCDLNDNEYVRQAYEAKKWAFVSDYFRFKVLYEQGGIYVDTDMEFTDSIDRLRLHPAFFPFETKTDVNACILGSLPGNPLMLRMMETYEKDSFTDARGRQNTEAIISRITGVLRKSYPLKLNGRTQTMPDGTALYAPNALIFDAGDGRNMAEHHYEASWLGAEAERKGGGASYKEYVMKSYFDSTDFVVKSKLTKNFHHLLHDRQYLMRKTAGGLRRWPKLYRLVKRVYRGLK